jgi:hypothetical protein
MATLIWTYPKTQGPAAEQHAANARIQNPGNRYTVKYNAKGVTEQQLPSGRKVGIIGVYEVWEHRGSGASSSGGGGGGGSPNPAPSPAPQLRGPAAVQAGLPGYSGPSPHKFRTAAANTQSFTPERMGAYFGLDSYTPENKMGVEYSPDGLNIDDVFLMGSRNNRRGCAKLHPDRDNGIHDGQVEVATITCVAQADYTADTDYIIFRKPNGDTHAFWFDTTGSDTEPAGSQAADASTQVNISSDTTDIQVAATLEAAIDGASMGLDAEDSALDGTLTVTTTTGGWQRREFVTDDDFTMTFFAAPAGVNAAIHADYRGLSLSKVPGDAEKPDQLVVAFMDKDGAINDIPSESSLLSVSLHLVTPESVWGHALNLHRMKGPNVTASVQGGDMIRLVSDMQAAYPAIAGQIENSVRQICILYSTVAYPEDHDAGYDETGAVAIVDRDEWDGSSRTDDSADLPSGTYFVSVFAVSLEGVSAPTRRKVVIP